MQRQDDLDAPGAMHPHNRRVVYTLPDMDEATVRKDLTYKTVEDLSLKLDIYYPAQSQKQAPLPAVILVHGDGPADFLRDIKESGQYIGWGQLIAATGLVAVTANHRSTEGLHNVVGVANDIDDLISYVRDHSQALHIDPDRLCIWTCSAGGPTGLRAALYESPLYVRAIVCYYNFVELKTLYTMLYETPDSEEIGPAPTFLAEDFDEFSAPELLLRRPGDVAPMFIARAGLDYPELNEALDRFIQEALTQNVALTVMNHPLGQHGFDTRDDDERSREIIQATLEFIQRHLME